MAEQTGEVEEATDPLPQSAGRHTRAAEEGSQVDVLMFLGVTHVNGPSVAITSKYVKRCVCV